MAKRAPVDEELYRPLLDPGVASAAITKAGTPPKPADQPRLEPKVVELTRQESKRPDLPPAHREEFDTPAGQGRAVPSSRALPE